MSETPLPPSSDETNDAAKRRAPQLSTSGDVSPESTSKLSHDPKGRSGTHAIGATEGEHLVHTFYDSYPSFGSSNAMSEAFSKAGLTGEVASHADSDGDDVLP